MSVCLWTLVNRIHALYVCMYVCFTPGCVQISGLSTSRGTGLRAEEPLRWPAGRWAAPRADRWPLAEQQDGRRGVS